MNAVQARSWKSRRTVVTILIFTFVWSFLVSWIFYTNHFQSTGNSVPSALTGETDAIALQPPNAFFWEEANTTSTITASSPTRTMGQGISTSAQENCAEGEPFWTILRRAYPSSLVQCKDLPPGQHVIAQYGDHPVVLGMERCHRYRAVVGSPSKHPPSPRIAGLYNTGTNAMAKLWELNLPNLHLHVPNSYFKYDVPWGKHVPWSHRNTTSVPPHNPTPREMILPIVLIRDPYWWMVSMCQHPYGVKWKRDHLPVAMATSVSVNSSVAGNDKRNAGKVWEGPRCPNLVNERNEPVPIVNKYSFGRYAKQRNQRVQFSIHYISLIDLWNTYYEDYLNSPEPRLVIRFEDVLFHGPVIMDRITECLGIPYPVRPFQYYTAPSKHHDHHAPRKRPNPQQKHEGDHLNYNNHPETKNQVDPSSETDFLQALIRYGTNAGRGGTMNHQDRLFAQRTLNRTILELFHYNILEE